MSFARMAFGHSLLRSGRSGSKIGELKKLGRFFRPSFHSEMKMIYEIEEMLDFESDLTVGDFFINCNYMPCVVISITPEIDDLTYLSIMEENGGAGSCSLRYCGPTKIKKEMISEYIAALPYTRHVIENLDKLKEDKDWMAWFGDRIEHHQKMKKIADHVKGDIEASEFEKWEYLLGDIDNDEFCLETE